VIRRPNFVALFTTLAVSLVGLVGLAGCGGSVVSDTLREPNTAPETLSVTLGGLDGDRFRNAQVFSGFGCTGDNRSPAISWSNAPAGTQSFAIIVHDPDAPTGVGFFHWIALDLPPSTTSLAENAAAEGLPASVVQGYTDFGTNSYGGPCPPPGPGHRYEVTVYALDVPSLGIPASSTGALARFVIRQHTLALGRAVAHYAR